MNGFSSFWGISLQRKPSTATPGQPTVGKPSAKPVDISKQPQPKAPDRWPEAPKFLLELPPRAFAEEVAPPAAKSAVTVIRRRVAAAHPTKVAPRPALGVKGGARHHS